MIMADLEQLNVSTLTSADVAEIAARLEADEYTTTSEELRDWHLLRAIAFRRPELAEPYFYLLDMEAYDEA
ncbi:MAG: DUF2555 domain-containing protein [Leptolyngbyaceae cyanobacterium HOT.MB2.61]|jgi:hypothetical protein|nr:DUF2555 domain-containing protein [Leptolyngbyaceae cyanobacterium HOT.MB2.61]